MAAIWTVNNMMTAVQADGYTNVVQQVDWTVTDTDGTNTALKGGSTNMPTPGPTFTPYDQLTEAEVIGWVQGILGPDEVAAIEANLNQQIVYMQNPPIVSLPLPWSGV